MSKKVRVGIWGLGRAGRGMHTSEIKVHSDKLEIVAACDIDVKRAEDYEKAIFSIKKGSTILLILAPQRMSEIELTAKMVVKNKLNWNFVCFFLGEKSVLKATKILRKEGVVVYNKL